MWIYKGSDVSQLNAVKELNDDALVELSLTNDEVIKVITEAVNLPEAIALLAIVFTENNAAAITYGKTAFFAVVAKHIEADINEQFNTLLADRRDDAQIEAELYQLEMDAMDGFDDRSQDP